MSGQLTSIPLIAPDERSVLLDAGRSFNEYVQADRTYNCKPFADQTVQGSRPGDIYNARADWYSLLTSHGWKYMGSHGGVGVWKRPGKAEPGISATTNYGGSNLLYVFSTNTAPFEDNAAYSLFSAYALLNYGGDYRAAARALAAQGYGERRNKSHIVIVEPPRIDLLKRPTNTIKLAAPQRPTNTVKLSAPVRPEHTIKLQPEGRR